MKHITLYSRELRDLTRKLITSGGSNSQSEAMMQALDGQPSKVLRSKAPLAEIRNSGAFFTGKVLANKLIESIIPDIMSGAAILDPACGAGDLLLACAQHMPVSSDLETTLVNWGQLLRGSDIYEEFINITKSRLTLLALHKGANATYAMRDLDLFFPNIQIRDGLSNPIAENPINCIVINPPYSLISAPNNCEWSSGRVSQAALFLEKYLVNMKDGTKIVAILPDVLRTGTRYIRWRERIQSIAEVMSIEIIGQFDRQTDIDVFIIRLIAGKNNYAKGAKWWQSTYESNQITPTTGDLFDIAVGPVVPHRHPNEGMLFPFIRAHELPAWKSLEPSSEFRKFKGTTFQPPFVVIRRTSRPEDEYRAIGTIIIGKRPVAVENHLILLRPKSRRLKDCYRLITNLRDPRTKKWFDDRIRCRHLTTASLCELPWWIG